MILAVPLLDRKPWPTLGPQVCDFIEEHLVFGPGDLLGQPAVLDELKRGLIYRLYEVIPRGRNRAGRRRFTRAGVSLRKGVGKTEWAAWLAACELSARAPVRTVDWYPSGEPKGGPVTDPYIPMMAVTEDQSEELAYGALRAMLEYSDLADDFDIGLERIMRRDGHGKAEALAAAPASRDGARTTFQHFDETWHYVLPRHKKTHRTMLANAPKRVKADAWSLETTTAHVPGTGSVAEDAMDYARAVEQGQAKSPRYFFFHMQASDRHNVETKRGRRAAVKEASGDAASWSDIEGIVSQFDDPKADFNHLCQVWFNQPRQSEQQAFDAAVWKKLATFAPGYRPAAGALITLGFDGARYRDGTGIIGTEVKTGFQWPVGCWEKPFDYEKRRLAWEVPIAEVLEAMDMAFNTYDVWRLYADPPYWETVVVTWAGKYGDKRVVIYPTNRWSKMAGACRAFNNAIKDGAVKHDGDEGYARHIGNAHKKLLRMRHDEGEQMWVIQKARGDSPFKIDFAVAGVLSWQARLDALAVNASPKRSVYWDRGAFVVSVGG